MSSETWRAWPFLEAARVPDALQPQDFGLWQIRRRRAADFDRLSVEHVGWPTWTILYRHTIETIHHECGTVVMEDSFRELSRHLPILMCAKGDVLVTGLGLGCVVRGLLANPNVDHIDVVELDRDIIDRVYPHLGYQPRPGLIVGDVPALNIARLEVHHADAFDFVRRTTKTWDWAWHDLWVEGPGLPVEHVKLMTMLRHRVTHRQGAWGFDRRTRQLIRRTRADVLGVTRPR